MSDEKVTFEADVGRLLQAHQRVDQAIAKTKRQMQDSVNAAAAGSEVAIRGYIGQERAIVKLTETKRRYDASMTQTINGTKMLGSSMGKTNMVIGQLSYAMDDFLTVVGDMGLAGSLKAAGNNLSVVLAQLNPMLAVVPSVAIAIATMASSSGDAAEKTKALQEAMKRSEDAARSYRDVMASLSRGIADATKTPAQIAMEAEDKAIADAKQGITDNQLNPILKEKAGLLEERGRLQARASSSNPHTAIGARRDLDRLEPKIQDVEAREGKARGALADFDAKKFELDQARMGQTIRETIIPGFRRARRMAGDILEKGAENTFREVETAKIDRQKLIVEEDQERLAKATEQARAIGSEGKRKGLEITQDEQKGLDQLKLIAETSAKQLELMQRIFEENMKSFQEDNLAKQAARREVPLDRNGNR